MRVSLSIKCFFFLLVWFFFFMKRRYPRKCRYSVYCLVILSCFYYSHSANYALHIKETSRFSSLTGMCYYCDLLRWDLSNRSWEVQWKAGFLIEQMHECSCVFQSRVMCASREVWEDESSHCRGRSLHVLVLWISVAIPQVQYAAPATWGGASQV